MKLIHMLFVIALAAAPAAADCGCAQAGLVSAEEARIQAKVLDALLGPGKAFAFLDLKAELKTSEEEEGKSGTGEARTKLPDAGQKTQEQMARQTRGSSEKKVSSRLELKAMKLRVLYDAALPQERLKAVRDALLALYPGALADGDIAFVAASFAR